MKRIRWPAFVVAGVVVAGSGTAYAVTNDGTSAHYRTVRATKDDVEEVLTASGTVDAAHRADLEVGTSGTVAAVKVALGDTVKAGQVIARLDTGELEAAVTRAEASLARAKAQLESDEDAQAESVSDAASTPKASKPKGSSTPSSSPTAGTDPAVAAALAELTKQQAAVIEAQTAASAAIAAAKDALAAQTDACAQAYQAPSGSQGDGGASAGDTSSDANDACAAALDEVQAKQAAVGDAQDDLAAALSALAGTLSTAAAAIQDSSGSNPSAASTDSPSTSGSSTPSSAPSSDSTSPTNGSGATSGEVSAAQLASDQAEIEQARADLVDARQQLGQAVLRSTRSGKIVALDVAKGDQVSAGDVAAVVVGSRAVTIETTVPESKIDEVAVGQKVRVSTPGVDETTEGTVARIGLVADSSSGTASYAVTVTVEDPAIALPTGSQALLAIVVATAEDVVTVPTSAVTKRGDSTFVRTWDGSKLSDQAVTVGTVGSGEVEITKGLSAGDEVVLADIDQAISGASDKVNDRGGFNGPPVMRLDKAGAGGGGPVTFKSGG